MNTQQTNRRNLLRQAAGASTLGIVGVAGCTGDSGTTSITLASSFEPGHINVETGEIFGDKIEEETGGDIEIDVVAGGSYGAEDEIADLVREGSVEGSTGGALPHILYSPAYAFFMAGPYVMEDYDHILRAMDSDLMDDEIDTLIDAGNQRRISQPIYRGFRHFTANQPIQHPDDLSDIVMRYDGIDARGDIFSATGADPQPVPLDELYSALQQGTVNASEGDMEQIASFNLFEVQSHVSLTSHLMEVGIMYLNEDIYQGLDESHQDAVDELAQEATEEGSEIAQDREDDLQATLEEEGMTIVDDVEVEAFRTAAEPAIQNWFDEVWVGSWDDIRNI